MIDPTIEALLQGLSPSSTSLLEWLKPIIDDSMLRDIAYADYGLNEEEYFAALVPIRDGHKIPDPLPWFPREALHLRRWSEPDDPVWKPHNLGPNNEMNRAGLIWKPQARGERGHWIRFFSCAVLLRAADDVESQDYITEENDTLIQFIASALRLGADAVDHALRLLYWRTLRMSSDKYEYPFFAMAILLLRVTQFEKGSNAKELQMLADWVIAEEARGRLEIWRVESEEWLLGLTNFDQRHDRWREVASAVLMDPSTGIPEPAASTLREVAGRIAPRRNA
ncbi:hypothetical protein CCAX7_10340 [Capsulimonas corticalis]|uniref:Uncharacterized protein n=1 Tax=Capsulimonas corticalis TaxID=2219043 RepID=A0A402CUF6_9BACT|nr:hypothetical protein [Capsulimonas corticalis]BDI28983.1 hypothetical protein CCAX7_10340 [Capsulimonas corticalis]